MNLILTSDLHRDGAKLLWLLDEAPQHDALLVAGDLLDIFSNTVMSDQTSGALRWRDVYLKSGKSLAWCSGNHDFYHGDHTPTSEASPIWMRKMPSSGNYLTDGESRLLNVGQAKVAVTTLPWPVSDGEFSIGGTRRNPVDRSFSRTSRGHACRGGLLCDGSRLHPTDHRICQTRFFPPWPHPPSTDNQRRVMALSARSDRLLQCRAIPFRRTAPPHPARMAKPERLDCNMEWSGTNSPFAKPIDGFSRGMNSGERTDSAFYQFTPERQCARSHSKSPHENARRINKGR